MIAHWQQAVDRANSPVAMTPEEQRAWEAKLIAVMGHIGQRLSTEAILTARPQVME